ncbi:MAG: hypothetical protein EOM40_09170 [Clostridia bacterium]|nr:hypothetical protein [Clostridia bacterium]NCC44500.1 hypothetical protein [Clostridia bacterium]
MSGYILCQVKRAKLPYYIENISTNIYSIEELCFYLYHNIYLLDSTIINEELCFWIRDELGLKKLAQKLYGLLTEELKVGDFILPIFKEINYLSLEEFRKLNQQIQKLAEEPLVLRQKLKGDYLMDHGKYVNAIKVYQKALHDKAEGKPEESDQLGGQFIGGIYHNMGCAYARLFQMEEAVHCFSKAYEHLRTMASIKSYLYAVYMESGVQAFEDKSEELGIEGARKEEVLKEVEQTAQELFETEDGQEYAQALEYKQAGDLEGYRKALDIMLERLTSEYHRSTGY